MKTGLISGALACVLGLPASADNAPHSRPLIGGMGNDSSAFIALYDDSGDGKLDWTEFETFRRHRFDATDSNRDGTVDIEEYVREFKSRSDKALQNHRATQLEMTRTRFAALDTDKDGSVSRQEFDASGERVFAQGQKTLAALEDGSDTALRPRSRDALMPTSHTAEGFLSLYDTDADGQVLRAEFADRRNAQFASTDKNGDARLDASEYMREFEARLDARIAELQGRPDTQSRVRFRSLDKDADGRMTFAEYQISGKRMFENADRNHDRIVDTEDGKLPPVSRNAPGITHSGLPAGKKP